jgi:AcrR family transcriptional regulator
MGRPLTDHNAVRRRLVAHGRALIREEGAGALVLAEVARREGVSTPTLYHYFANRRALVIAVLAAEVDDLVQVSSAPADAGAHAHQRLAMFMDAQTEYLERVSPHTLAFVLGAILDSADDPDLSATVRPVFGRAEAVFRACSKDLDSVSSRRQQRAVGDLLRTFLAGLFLMRALGTDVEVGAVEAELRSRL